MKYILKTTKQYAKQLKKCIKRGYDESKLENVVDYLVEGRPLPEKYHAHRLSAKFGYCWECHITPDWPDSSIENRPYVCWTQQCEFMRPEM